MDQTVSVTSEFIADVDAGLSSFPKFLPSKYFYDQTGDKIFQAIMHMPEYYLTSSEYEIINNKKASMLEAFGTNGDGFELVEFGAGDGLKTNLLLKHFLEREAKFRFVPIDISGSVLHLLEDKVKDRFPDLDYYAVNDDYFSALEELNRLSSRQKIILFLGANIGNFLPEKAVSFLKEMNRYLKNGDKIMIGFDLKKNPKTILEAYNDKTGFTKAFNLNLLHRLNRELGANFQVDRFDHYPIYDPVSGAARSYLISLADQRVHIEALKKEVHFKQWEYVYTEVSQKYDLKMIEELAKASGFKVTQNFFDCRHYFVDSLWSVKI